MELVDDEYSYTPLLIDTEFGITSVPNGQTDANIDHGSRLNVAHGSINERRYLSEDGVEEKIHLKVQFSVSGTNWSDSTIVLSYLQYEDPENPGKHVAVTCSAKYDRPEADEYGGLCGQAESNDVAVHNFYGKKISKLYSTWELQSQQGNKVEEHAIGRPFF